MPYVLESGRMIQGKNCIALAGTMSNNRTQVQVLDINNIGNSYTTTIRGVCSSMEICGISQSMKNFAAVASSAKMISSVFLFELDVLSNTFCIGNGLEFQQDHDDNFAFTSLAFGGQLLASGSERGDILLYDLYTASQSSKITANHSGINSLKFSRAGYLLSTSDSKRGHLQLWDCRSKSPSIAKSINIPSRDLPISLTAVYPHVSNECEIFCGTSVGSIIQFDTRRDGILDEYVAHAGGRGIYLNLNLF